MRRPALAILLAALSLGSAFAQRVVKVDTAREFIEAIAPGAVIQLAPGRYDLSSVARFQSDWARWDESSGERELVIEEVEELEISGEGAELTVSSPYARILSFRGCSTVALRGLSMAHRVSEPCMAGVLGFENCADIVIEGCELRGSGAVGLELTASNGIVMSGGEISGCNVGAIWIDGSWNAGFDNLSVFDNSGGYPLIRVSASNDVSFVYCSFHDNSGDSFLSDGSATELFGFENCDFTRNRFGVLSYEKTQAYFHATTYEDNSFDDELAKRMFYVGEGKGGDDMDGEGMGGLYYHELEGSGLAFDYPDWLVIDDSDPGKLFIDSGESGPEGVLIGKVYELKRNDDPDTEATRIFKAAAPYAERWLALSGLSVKKRTSEEPVNTEAPPYHYEYWADGRSGSDEVKVRIKLMHGQGAIWCFAAYHADPGMIDMGSDYGMILDFVTSTEY